MGHIFTVLLPDIGEGVVEGEVVEWLKKVGEPVSQDEPVVVVMTDKATVELPAPHPGILAKQYYSPAGIAIRGKPLYDIEVAGETSEVKEEKKNDTFTVGVPLKPLLVGKEIPCQSPRKDGEKALAIPPVRKLAKELGIDINCVQGTGKNGRVTPHDLRGSLAVKPPSVTHLPGDEEKTLVGIQGLMAKKMALSKSNIPHFSYHENVDATRLIQLRENVRKQGAKEGVEVTFMPFFIRAMSLTVAKFPLINSCFDSTAGKLIIHKQHNVGVAMSTDNGLIVPVLKGVQEMGLEEIVRKFHKLKSKAKNNKLDPSDMKDSTVTISNYGAVGEGLWATPIINIPEVTILAVNKIQKQPIVKHNQIVVVDVLNLSWSFDHRVIDGALAAKVSSAFTHFLENPAKLL